MKRCGFAVFFALLSAGAMAQGQHEQPRPPVSPPPLDDKPTDRTGEYPPGALEFDRVDKNHDGMLSADEIGGTPIKLSECDGNGDGRISREEYSSCKKT